MAVDRYTKLVLTVIAVCLAWIAFGGPSVVRPVAAQSGYERVVLYAWVDENGTERPLPAARFAGAPERGKPVPPAPLPIWNAFQ